MEFVRELHYPGVDIPRLKRLLTIDNLPGLCKSISTATASNESEGNIYCLWGAFTVRRDEIRHGVRYALINCPHALAWTVTYDETRQKVIIHCTIDKTQEEPEFIESIHEFVSDWTHGMTQALQN